MISWLKLHDKKSNDTFKIAIITSLLTIFASIGGISVQNFLTTRASQKESLRVQQRETYLKFEDAYNSYSYATADFKECLLEQAKQYNINIADANNYARLAELGMEKCDGGAFSSKRFAFQVSVNLLYLDGSSAAVRLARLLSTYVPPPAGYLTDKHGLPPLGYVLGHNLNLDNQVYTLFLAQACRDARPSDKKVCEEFSTGRSEK
jgi:hypothetical protein